MHGLIGSVRSILIDGLSENDKPGLFITCGGNMVRCNLMTQFCDPHTSSCHDCQQSLSGTTELTDVERDALHDLCSVWLENDPHSLFRDVSTQQSNHSSDCPSPSTVASYFSLWVWAGILVAGGLVEIIIVLVIIVMFLRHKNYSLGTKRNLNMGCGRSISTELLDKTAPLLTAVVCDSSSVSFDGDRSSEGSHNLKHDADDRTPLSPKRSSAFHTQDTLPPGAS